MLNTAAIPDELRALRQWVVWTLPKKIPHSPETLEPASSTDPKTWSNYETALACLDQNGDRFAGIGFCFTDKDPYCGIDLDDCLEEGGIPYTRAWRMIERFRTYSEISPSGRGVKMIVKASKPGPKCKSAFRWDESDGQIEMYDTGRYFTITGNALPDTPAKIEERQDEVEALYRQLWPTIVPGASAQANSVADRVRKYLEKCPDSISGNDGHGKCLRAACECMRFGLSDADTWAIMRWWSASKSGEEPWSDREIEHKIASARAKVGAEGGIGIRLRPTKSAPEPFIAPQIDPDSSDGVRDRFKAIASGAYYAAPWAWPTIGRLTQALLPGAITLFCGDPGSGKSFWILSAIRGWIEMGVEFGVFMLEEDRTYHLQRFLSIVDGNARLVDMDWAKDHPEEAQSAYNRNAAIMRKLHTSLYDAPQNRVTLMQLADWYEQVAPKVRVAVIDPVTAAATAERRWIEDGQFVERVKTIARNTGTSLVLVTHPKLGRKGAITLDDLAGGADYSRFTQTVFSLSVVEAGAETIVGDEYGPRSVEANRIIKIHKARNGVGGGRRLAFKFDPKDLSFHELGVVVHD